MTVRDETAKTPGETGAWSPERPRHTLKQYVEAARGEPARLAAEACSQVRRPRACEVERYPIDLARE
jgi:hypothetical protein